MNGESATVNAENSSAVARGLALGLLGVTMFAFSIPMTRLASGSSAAPQLDPLFVAFGRAAVAAVLSMIYLGVLWLWARADVARPGSALHSPPLANSPAPGAEQRSAKPVAFRGSTVLCASRLARPGSALHSPPLANSPAPGAEQRSAKPVAFRGSTVLCASRLARPGSALHSLAPAPGATHASRIPWRRPVSADLRPLAWTAAGVVFGWPIFLGLAVREVEAVHASVISGVLPLVTAMFAAWRMRQRASTSFWAAAVSGCALVVAFALLREWQHGGAIRLTWADLLLLAAVASASAGYVGGARLAGRIPADQVICWVLLLSLPLTLPVAWLTRPLVPVSWAAWGGFAYVSLFSMWLGMLVWYRALALGGTLRVSQVQLLQPFLSLLFCVPVLGETLDALTLGFSLAIIATVFWSRRASVKCEV